MLKPVKLEEWQEQQKTAIALEKENARVTADKLVPGALVVSRFGETYITTKYSEKDVKKTIIIGVDKEKQCCYGLVFINTRPRYQNSPNAEYTKDFAKGQLVLRSSQYGENICGKKFLDYDSYINCSNITSIPFEVLEKGTYYGKLNKHDYTRIFNKLRKSTTISDDDKIRYGLIPEGTKTTSSHKFDGQQI